MFVLRVVMLVVLAAVLPLVRFESAAMIAIAAAVRWRSSPRRPSDWPRKASR